MDKGGNVKFRVGERVPAVSSALDAAELKVSDDGKKVGVLRSL